MRSDTLDGVRILDLTRVLAGPYCTLLLADLGAEVIKIEDPEEGDPTREMGPKWKNGISAYFLSINRNKKGITLNLKSKKGREIFYELVQISDVVVYNFRPDVPQRLRVDHPTLSKINERIISCSISAFGSYGPRAHQPAFDLSIQALSGAMSITGHKGLPPVRMGIPLGDLAGGMFGAISIISALYHREKTGKGCFIDLSLLDCNISLLTYVAQYFLIDRKVPEPIGSAHQTIVPYQAFKTKDSYLVVAILTEKFWSHFVDALGLPDLKEDRRFLTNEKRRENKETLIKILQKKFLERTTAEWIKKLEGAGIPCAPVYTVDQALYDYQVIARNMLTKIEDVEVVGNPFKFSDCHKKPFVRPPHHGEHTKEVLQNLLHMNISEIESLKREGII